MDAYLSDEARQFLQAQALETSGRMSGGLLLGHLRGPRFFVERVYPCSLRPFLSLERFRALSCIFDHKIIGFYGSGRWTERTGRKIPPFAVNKLYLEFDAHPRKGLILRPAVAEYNGSFELVPVALAPRLKSGE